MVARADILAGRAVILVNIQDTVEAQLRSIRSKMRMFSNSMKEIGGDLFRGGLAGTAGSIFPVKEFVNFQDQLLFLQTKLQVTDAAMKPLEKTIRTLGMSTSFTSQEVAKAATDFAQAGFSMVEITNSLQAALDLARGSQIELSTSTTILANALRTFNVNTERAAEFASKFIAAARLGTLDLVDLSESLKYSSGTFALLNVEIDEVLGLITQLSKSSLKASLAGTSLNTAFLNLAGSADKLKDLLGVVFTDEDFEQPLIVLTKIEKALQGMSTTKKISIVQDLVNIRGARAVFGEIIQDLGKLDETTQQIRNSTGEARMAAEKLDSRLGGVWRRARSAFEESLLAVGATTEGPLTRFGEIAAKVFNDISRLASQNEVLTQSILGLGVASLAAGVGILGLSALFGRLAMFITPLTMLNAQLFKMAGALVGLQMKTFGAIGGAIAAPILARQQAVAKARMAASKAEEQLVKAQARYQATPNAKNAGKLGAATVASKNALSALSATRGFGGTLGQKAIPFVATIEKLFSAFKALPPSAVPDFKQVFTAFRGVQQGSFSSGIPTRPNQTFTPANFKLPILNSAFQRRRLGSGSQGLLPGFSQGLLDFGSSGSASGIKAPNAASLFRSGDNKIISPKLWENILATALDLKGLKQYRNSPIRDVIEEAFTAFNVSDSTKKAFTGKILNALRETKPAIQKEFDFGSSQGLLNFDQPAGQRLFGPTSIIGRNATDTSFGFLPPGISGGAGGGKGANSFRQRQSLAPLVKETKQLRMNLAPVVGFFKSMGTTIKSLNFGFAFAELGKVLKALWRAGSSVDWVHRMMQGFRGAWTAVRGIFTVMNGLRRLVFSFSGILTILELLILFGDKIPGISDLLAGAGTAFSNLFKNLGGTIKSLAPTFDHLGTAIKLMFGGDAQSGIMEAQKALSNMKDLVGIGLRNAWNQFVEDTRPFADWMKVTLLGTLYTIESVFETIASTLGTVFKSGKILISPDGDFLEVLRDTFSTDNMKVFFVGLLEFIGSIGSSLNTVIGSVAQILEVIKRSMFGVLQALAILPGEQGSEAQTALNSMDKNYRQRSFYEAKIAAIEKEKESLVGDGTTAAVLRRAALNREQSKLQDLVEILSPVLAQSDTKDVLEQQNTDLANKIAEAIAKVNAIPTGPARNGFGPLTKDQQEAKTLEENAKADALAAKTIGIPISNLLKSAGGFLGGLDLSNGRSPLQVGSGGYDNNPLQEGTREAVNDFLKNPSGSFMNAFDLLKDGLGSIYATQPEDMKKTVEAVKANIPAIGKALVGTFDSTRGNLLQGVPTMEKLQREANEKLDEANGNLEGIASNLAKGATFA